MDYSYAKLGGIDMGIFRTGGPGLGNLLLRWARFVVGTRRLGLRPLAPTWPQFKLGPLLRNESDKRFYRGLFITPHEQISGLKRLLLMSSLSRVSESEFLERIATHPQRAHRPWVVEFDDADPFFTSIQKDHYFVRDELLRITREKHRRGLQYDFGSSISVHVRLGDFKDRSLQTPLTWFVKAVSELRRVTSIERPVYIFSEGEDDELQPLLALPHVRRIGFGSSIADILGLSCANTLIANGGSTFSKWGSYLGRMPVIWPPGTLYDKLYYDRPSREVEWKEGDSLPDEFVGWLNSN